MDLAAPSGDTFHARWLEALSDLELDLAETEAMLNSDHIPLPTTPWTPPSGLGPLPEPLRERAQHLLERQTEVAQRLAEALVLSRRQARLNESLKAGGPRRPVYLDTAG